MKKIIVLLLMAALLTLLFSCGEGGNNGVESDSESITETDKDTEPVSPEVEDSETLAPETDAESIEDTEPVPETTDYPYDTSLPVNSVSFSVKTPITYPRYEEKGYDYFGAQHLQGFCTDDKLEYMYFSLTGMIVKVDMKTGEEAGKFIASRDLQSKGFHMGDVTYHDGYLYTAITFWNSDKTYIGVIKADDINGSVDETRADFKAENTILRGVLTENCMPVNTLPDSGDWKYATGGFDGITVGTIPGKGYIKADGTVVDDAKTYLLVCLTTSLTDTLRYDDDNKQVVAFDFDSITEENLLPLTRARLDDKKESLYLEFTYRMFIYLGDHKYSVQTLECDKDTGDYILICYPRAEANEFPKDYTFVVDGSKKLYIDEVEVGRSVDNNSPDYNVARIKAYEYTDTEDLDEDGDTDEPSLGFHMTLKCICGLEDIEAHPLTSYGETGKEIHYCGAKFGSSNGIVSIGNGYYYNASQANNSPKDENGNPKKYSSRDAEIKEYGAKGTLYFLNRKGPWGIEKVK